MKYFAYILFLSFLVFSCNQTSTGTNNGECSKENPHGKCADDKTCILFECHDNTELCSSDKPSGLCDVGYICDNGECAETGTLPCSLEHPKGKCKQEANICFNGVCINESELCSETNLTGRCEAGKTCKQGVCIDANAPCSSENPNGVCEGSKTCVDGECVQVNCIDGQKRNCYPDGRDRSEANKGICRLGIQFCKNSKWEECKGAVIPQEEICDYKDNDCDGEIDEGVKNICGDCRKVEDLPKEIPNNNIDDDCDGKIDEDDDNNGGMTSCDGRMHQPCYKGPAGTSAKGICKGGFRDCTWDTTLNDWGVWGECIGQVLPQEEICNDNIDNNCNGIIDENCQEFKCKESEICGNNIDDNCNDLIDEGCSTNIERHECSDTEICNNGLDDNCDGNIDENCECGTLTELDCFGGDPSMLNHEETTTCKQGKMYCVAGEGWGSCKNQVLPTQEICDGLDNDCDGIIDNNAIDGDACGRCDGEPLIEICGNNIDDNCDGFVDENCPSDNCTNPTEEICDGADNDCDGLIDEGVLNSCGKCDDSCYEINIGTDNPQCNENSANYPECLNNVNDNLIDDDNDYDGIGTDPNDPNKLTLDSSTIQNDYIWIANSEADPNPGASDTVTKINTKTRAVEGTFPVGDNPSRTAVERDGSVWVANRSSHDVTKLNADGSLAFTVNLNIDCAPRGVAIDRNGNAWVGCFSLRQTMGSYDGAVYKISPTGTIYQGFPYQTATPIYGLAIDSRGYLWSSRLSDYYTGSNAQTVLKIDTNKNPGDNGFFKQFPLLFSNGTEVQTYGIVVDSNDHVWYGGWGNGGINELIYNESSNSITVTNHPFSGGGNGRGIATDSHGNIWCAFSTSNRVGKFDSNGNELGNYSSNGSSPIGIGVDSEDEIWVINRDSAVNQAVELNQDGSEKGHQTTGNKPYSYSDLTGFNLRNIVSPSGSFKTIVDTKRTDAKYDSISWVGNTPNGSSIKIRARISNNRNYFLLNDTDPNSPEWSNFVTISGEHLTWPSGNIPSGRFIQIEVVMSIGATNDDKPSLSNIKVNWQRP